MKSKTEVGLLLDKRYLKHSIGGSSPENPDRIRGLESIVREKYVDRCKTYLARTADREHVEAVHSNFYLQQIDEHIGSEDPYSYDKDTYLMGASLETALLAAGGCFELADRIISGELDYGFGLIRPPGHHAEPGRGMGFCIFNNISIVAQYLRNRYQLNRILILDFDAHHGNGTQEIFYDTNEVLVVSIHQKDLFPFSGAVTELGTEAGQGYNINIPVHAQFGDQEYTYLLGRLFQTVVEQYLPQIILVSAGYDAHQDDTISGTVLSTEWFGLVTAMLKQYAAEFCDNRLLMVLEGGYNPVSLQASVLCSIDSLFTQRSSKIGILYSERGAKVLQNHPLQNFWTL